MSYLIFHVCCAIAAIYFANSGPKRGDLSFGLIFVSLMFGPLAALLMWALRNEDIKKDEALRRGDD